MLILRGVIFIRLLLLVSGTVVGVFLSTVEKTQLNLDHDHQEGYI